MSRGFWGPPALVVLGALLVFGATSAGWVTVEQSRDIGGVSIADPVSTSGTAFAPSAVAVALALLVAGAAMGVVRRTPRRVLGAGAAAIAIAGAVLLVRGALAAAGAEGTLTAGPWGALLGALLAVGGGAAAARGRTAGPPSGRYEVPAERATDDEWALASPDEDDASG